ncbi:hypothetical protein B0I28_102753 [Glycomyces artemisiae]|uniref:Uncharacterized protein n=1 Tax=Glycomyces artemisiae TaxID=1076443 RepID=A0A2T0UT97_9ACTN|nr:hypothetical protein B0I28_102753 [Glycomyces artemisiae]
MRMSIRAVLTSVLLVLMVGVVAAVSLWFASRSGTPGDEASTAIAEPELPEAMCDRIDLSGIDRLAGERDPDRDYFADEADLRFDCDFWYTVTDVEGAWLKVTGEVGREQDWSGGIENWIDTAESVHPLTGAEDWDAAGLVVSDGVGALQTTGADRTGTAYELRLADGDLRVQIFFEHLETADGALAPDEVAEELVAIGEQVREAVGTGS